MQIIELQDAFSTLQLTGKLEQRKAKHTKTDSVQL